MSSGLRDFQDYFQQFIGLIAAGVVTTALVLVSALLQLAPPWPPALVPLTAIAQLIALIFVYQRLSRAKRTLVDRLMTRSLVLLVVFLVIYLILYSLLIFEMPNGDRDLRGFVCSKDALTLYSESCPFLERLQIAEAEFEAERLWTRSSLTTARLAMIVTWVGFFASLVTLVAAFVVFQRRQSTSGPTQTTA